MLIETVHGGNKTTAIGCTFEHATRCVERDAVGEKKLIESIDAMRGRGEEGGVGVGGGRG